MKLKIACMRQKIVNKTTSKAAESCILENFKVKECSESPESMQKLKFSVNTRSCGENNDVCKESVVEKIE